MITSRRAVLGSFVALASLLVVACGDDSTDSQPTGDTVVVAQLQGNEYELKSASQIEIPEGVTMKMTFLATNLAITGGCNDMTGGWGITAGNLLLVPALGQTQKACDEALMNFDSAVAQIVSSQPVVTIDGDQMSLDKDGATLSFTLAAGGGDQAVPLEGTEWKVTGTLDETTLPEVVQPATLKFNSGTLEVFAGCNTGSGSYTATESDIEFGPIAITKMACDDAANTLEQTVLSVLTGTQSYVIEGNTLTITADDGSGLTAESA